MNHFERLGLATGFEIDMKALEQAYFARQRKTHPDMFVAKPEAERLAAAQEAMNVNEAYHTLKSPLARAEYLLKLHGLDVNAEQGEIKPDHTTLVEMMEQRETLSSAVNPQQIDEMIAEHHAAIEQTVTTLSNLFAQAQWNRVAQETIRLRYLYKFIEEARVRTRILKNVIPA